MHPQDWGGGGGSSTHTHTDTQMGSRFCCFVSERRSCEAPHGPVNEYELKDENSLSDSLCMLGKKDWSTEKKRVVGMRGTLQMKAQTLGQIERGCERTKKEKREIDEDIWRGRGGRGGSVVSLGTCCQTSLGL